MAKNDCICPECMVLLLFHGCFFIKGSLTHNHKVVRTGSFPDQLKPVIINQIVDFNASWISFYLKTAVADCSDFPFVEKRSYFCRVVKIKELLKRKNQHNTIRSDWLHELSPAESIGAAGVPELQAAGLVPLLMGARRYDGAAPAFGARLIRAGAEEQRVA